MNHEVVVVVSAVRSPFGKFGGALKDFSLPKLGGLVAAEAIRRAGIAPGDVEEVATGINLPGADRSIARDRKSTRLNSSHIQKSRMPSSA